jgi:hypothetical protein
VVGRKYSLGSSTYSPAGGRADRRYFITKERRLLVTDEDGTVLERASLKPKGAVSVNDEEVAAVCEPRANVVRHGRPLAGTTWAGTVAE